MSIAATVAPELPMLRRFARLLAGSQSQRRRLCRGDPGGAERRPERVPFATAAPASFVQDLPAIVGFDAPAGDLSDVDYDPANAAERNLGAITPLPRQAFLLRTVEGFALADVAAILDKSPDEVADLIAQAGREIADQVATDVLIIEDEPIIAFDIEAMVQELGHDVTGIARTHREAIESMRKRRPGLVLADILLADGSSGLDAVNEILASIDVPVIFITAFPERLLTGEKPEPTYLDHQAVPAGHGARDDQSGAVFRLSVERRRGGDTPRGARSA